MKYLKLFENYYNFNDVKGEIEDIEFILQDLKDNDWIVNVDLVVKRWENPAANFHIKSDYIKVYIKKSSCRPGSKYPLNAEFSGLIVRKEINHIRSIYSENKIDAKICTRDLNWEKSLDERDIPRRNYLLGEWKDINLNRLEHYLNPHSLRDKILGIELKIYLETENIDQIKEHSYIDTWAEPNNPMRHEIEDNINFILSELNDGKSYYRFHVSWTESIPYVWIAGDLKENGIHRYKPIFSEVKPIVKSITAYLKSEGFQTEIKYLPNKENCKQFYIYFILDNTNESFNIDEDSEHLKDLSLDLKDEGEWSINVYTNTEKYNDDEYSCKVILEPLDEFDWDADTNSAGSKINDTMIQYLEDIVKYMEDYDYKIIICDTDQDPFFDGVRQNTIVLENLEKFNQWIKKEISRQGKTKSTEVGDSIILSTEYPDFLNFGYKGDFIIIEFYEKELF